MYNQNLKISSYFTLKILHFTFPQKFVDKEKFNVHAILHHSGTGHPRTPESILEHLFLNIIVLMGWVTADYPSAPISALS